MQLKVWWYGVPVVRAIGGLLIMGIAIFRDLSGVAAGMKIPIFVFGALLFLLGVAHALVRYWQVFQVQHGDVDGCTECGGPVDPYIRKCGRCGRRG